MRRSTVNSYSNRKTSLYSIVWQDRSGAAAGAATEEPDPHDVPGGSRYFMSRAYSLNEVYKSSLFNW